MPIYEYECEKCGAVTDIKHGFKETTSETCPKCNGSLKRLFNAASIVFKGSGFYVNDSRKSSDSASKSESTPKSESTKSDSPPKTDGGGKSGGGGKSDAAA